MASKLPAKQAPDIRKRGQRSHGGPQPISPDKVDLTSFTSIAGGMKYVAVEVAKGKIKPWQVYALTLIYKAAGLNLKMKIQRAGDWIKKRESKEQHTIISAELKDCLAVVQGSNPKDLKEISDKVNTILGGLRE